MSAGPVCRDCVTYKRFKEKCWYYWENKSACTQFMKSEFSEPSFKEVKELELPHVNL